jgi:DNA-binding MarR family transcriptional regulator
LERRREVVELLVDAIQEGRSQARGSLRPTRMIAEGAVGAVLGVLHARLSENRRADGRIGNGHRTSGRGDDVPGTHAKRRLNGHAKTRVGVQARGRAAVRGRSMLDLQGPLMAMIVLPYLGQAAAARELARPVPRRRRPAPPRRDPLRDLEMRLTYRTVRVLLAIADRPDASNREVAEASGVHDQGQISKLLARLEHVGLVRNRDGHPVRGEPNGWWLTPRGEAVERTLRERAAVAGP